MRIFRFNTAGRAVCVVVLAGVAVLVAYTGVLAHAGGSERSSAAAADDKKVKVQHYGRVKADGTLAGGTALTATRLSEGMYELTFPAPISGCGATASSTSFPGFDFSVFRVWAQISIGFGAGGAAHDDTVQVALFGSDGLPEDSSFSVLLMCS
jgi:hypothetical protein